MLICVLQKSYSLNTNTWICIYFIVVNNHISVHLVPLANKINTLYLHYCFQYAILVVYLFFVIWQQIHMHEPMSESLCISKERLHNFLIQ